MAKFVKDVLYTGTYTLPDGRKAAFTPDDVAHLEKRLHEWAEAGLAVPLCWEHQDDAKPLTQAERLANTAKFNLGFAEGAKSEAGNSVLSLLLDVPAPSDAARLASVRYCSPEIVEDFVDSLGRKWPGKSITHIAATARPIIPGQQPFQPVQMSGASGSRRYRLSLEGYTMADDKGDKKADDKKGDKATPEGGVSIKDILADLADYGIVLPDDTADENFRERLRSALVALKGKDGGAEEPKNEPGEVPAPPIAMSQTVKFLTERVLAGERDKLVGRIEKLWSTGRVSKPVYDKLKADATKVQLSLGANGELGRVDLLAKVEAYEDLPEGNTGFGQGPTRLSSGAAPREVPLPREAGTQRDPQKTVNDFFATTNNGNRAG